MVQLIDTFNYLPIDRVIYGQGAVARIHEILESEKLKNPLILTGRSVSSTEGFKKILDSIHCDFELYNQISQHSPMEEIEHAIETYRNARCDCIISIGGGSVIDSGKVLRYYFNTESKQIAIPTTLSAAEFSHIAGFSIGGEKQGVRDKKITPWCVILDPGMTMETPKRLWITSGIRALDHCIETVIHENISDIAKIAAFKAIGMLARNLNSDTEKSHLECQIASWYSYFQVYDSPMGISHNIGKIIGAKYEIPHGITSCLTLPLTVKYYEKYYPDEMGRVASAITGKDEGPENAAFLIQELLDTLNLKMKISDYGLGENDIPYIISKLKNKEPWHEELVKELLTRK